MPVLRPKRHLTMIVEVTRALLKAARGTYQQGLAEGRYPWSGRAMTGAALQNAATYKRRRHALLARAAATLPGKLQLARVLWPGKSRLAWTWRLVYTIDYPRDVNTGERLRPSKRFPDRFERSTP